MRMRARARVRGGGEGVRLRVRAKVWVVGVMLRADGKREDNKVRVASRLLLLVLLVLGVLVLLVLLLGRWGRPRGCCRRTRCSTGAWRRKRSA